MELTSQGKWFCTEPVWDKVNRYLINVSGFFGCFFFWLHWVFVAFSSCGEWGLLLVEVLGLLVAVASLVAEHGLCGVAPCLVESSRTRDQTSIPCIIRSIPNHFTTKEVVNVSFNCDPYTQSDDSS